MTSAYCVYDVKAKTYSAPQFLTNDDVARRMFVASCTEGSLFEMFPNDFELCYVGEFDEETGLFDQTKGIHSIAIAAEFFVKESEEINDDQV